MAQYLKIGMLFSLLTYSLASLAVHEKIASYLEDNQATIARAFRIKKEEWEEEYQAGIKALPIASKIMSAILGTPQEPEIMALMEEVLQFLATITASQAWHDVRYRPLFESYFHQQKKDQALGAIEKDIRNMLQKCLRNPAKDGECKAKHLVAFLLVNELLAADFYLPKPEVKEEIRDEEHAEFGQQTNKEEL